MPTWGQLGCNGFIVLDGSHYVVCRASAAYLQVSERAFRHVEELIDSLLGSIRAPPSLEGGDGSAGSSACAKVIFGADADEDRAEAETAPLPKVASVNVAVLDAEHAHCEAALAALAARRDAAALGHLLHAYEAHFAHEEALLDEHLYADVRGDGSEPAGAAFSADRGARASHYADHERMVRRVRSALVATPTRPSALQWCQDWWPSLRATRRRMIARTLTAYTPLWRWRQQRPSRRRSSADRRAYGNMGGMWGAGRKRESAPVDWGQLRLSAAAMCLVAATHDRPRPKAFASREGLARA